jgi:hypothetical protein
MRGSPEEKETFTYVRDAAMRGDVDAMQKIANGALGIQTEDGTVPLKSSTMPTNILST